MAKYVLSILFFILVAGCAPEVGSKAWCDAKKEQPKGEWTANDATDFAKHCLFGGEE